MGISSLCITAVITEAITVLQKMLVDMLSCHVLHQQNGNLMMYATVTFFILHRRKCHQLYLSIWLEKGHPSLHWISRCHHVHLKMGLQSSSCQTNEPFKTVKCVVLKDMSHVQRDIIKKYWGKMSHKYRNIGARLHSRHVCSKLVQH